MPSIDDDATRTSETPGTSKTKASATSRDDGASDKNKPRKVRKLGDEIPGYHEARKARKEEL